MTTDRLDEIIKSTAYPESNSVYQAVYQVENEMQQEFNSRTCENCKHYTQEPHSEPKCMSDYSKVYYTTKDFGCNKFERIEL